MKKFTLVELLVIIAILGILMTLLLPSLSAARAEAERAVCVSNMKQISIGVTMYGKDNNHYPPLHEMFSGSRTRWHQKLVPNYLAESEKAGRSDAFKCPTGPSLKWSSNSNIGMSSRMVGSDHMRKNNPNAARYNPVCRLSQVKTPSETLMLADSSDGKPIVDTWFFNTNNNQLFGNNSKICRHNQKVNILYFDLSASPMHYTKAATKTNYNSKFWNPIK
ncbi:MAG: DUF1559 domain-containing protein [Lentisphaeraceae bacterium]|nr:DUF1559 domain-containing protein [Lentisphaeraceae bacterium]